MVRVLSFAIAALLAGAAASFAQDPSPPIPLLPEPGPGIPGSPAPTRDRAAPPDATGSLVPPSAPAATTRIFCQQPVTIHLAERDSVPERYRGFLGIWSDAAWTPQLCAALIVETVAPDGTATILYAFGPTGSNARGPGGVLNGTGIVRDGELRFQNSDGSQFVFRPFYADLDGRLTTPQGQSYRAIFKKSL